MEIRQFEREPVVTKDNRNSLRASDIGVVSHRLWSVWGDKKKKKKKQEWKSQQGTGNYYFTLMDNQIKMLELKNEVPRIRTQYIHSCLFYFYNTKQFVHLLKKNLA